MKEQIIADLKEILMRKPNANWNVIAQILASKYKTRMKLNYDRALQQILTWFAEVTL